MRRTSDARSSRLLARLASPEVVSFLTVGGVGYVVDVTAFNYLRSAPILIGLDPTVAKAIAVGAGDGRHLHRQPRRDLAWRERS